MTKITTKSKPADPTRINIHDEWSVTRDLMIVETRACIVVRLLEISRELKRLKGLPPSERARLAKSLRVERRQLIHDLVTVPQMYEVRNDSH